MYLSALYHLRLSFKEELVELYTSRMLRSLGFSLIGVFIPLYLMNLGYSFSTVLMFLVFKYAAAGLFSPLIGSLQRLVGIKHLMMVSTVFLTAFFLMLYSITQYSWNVLFLGALSGIELMLFWIPMNADFSIHMTKKRIGQQVSYLEIIPRVVAVAAPFLGALIIVSYEFNVLLITACSVIICSAFPLLLTKDHHYRIKPMTKLFTPHNRKYFLIFLAEGFLSSAVIIWPLFIFFTMREYVFVGGLETLQSVAGILVVLVIGRASDKFDQVKLFKKAALISAVFWVSAVFVSGPFLVMVYSFLVGIVYVLVSMPFYTFVCKDSYHDHMVELMVYREVILSLGRTLPIALMVVVPFDYCFQFVFLATAASSAIVFFFKK